MVELARSDGYKGAGDSHLTELLADHHDIHLSRQSVQRILREESRRLDHLRRGWLDLPCIGRTAAT